MDEHPPVTVTIAPDQDQTATRLFGAHLLESALWLTLLHLACAPAPEVPHG